MVVHQLTSPAALPSTGANGLSVLSYNVLLPNSVDGWWSYKMYQSGCPSLHEVSSWEYRRNLLRERIATIDADVVCLQEASPVSFEEDFAFLTEELGYDGVELYRKGRFRPATFWRSRRCSLACPPVHKDRTLLTSFRLNSDVSVSSEKDRKQQQQQQQQQQPWHVLNCHLQAGLQGKRRLRQMEDGIKAVISTAKKMTGDNPASPLLVVCGDFNGEDNSAALRYLIGDPIGPDFVEDGELVSSKIRELPLSGLSDVALAIKGRVAPPPTLVVPELFSIIAAEAYDGSGTAQELSDTVVNRLTNAYKRYASDGVQMTTSDVERWLVDINGKVGRGSEFRSAVEEMKSSAQSASSENETEENKKEADNALEGEEQERPVCVPPDTYLSLEGFINVYRKELQFGKVWGIAHDLGTMGEPLPCAGLYEARFDRLYYSAGVEPVAVLDTHSEKPCPNEVEASDHLPVAAAFRALGT